MSGFAHDAAGASLTVAIGLLALASAAAVVLWAQVDDPRAQRPARHYLEPLSTWCLIALGTHTLALGAAGDLAVQSLALPLVLGAAAVVVRSAAEAQPPGQAVHRPAVRTRPAAPPAAPTQAPAPDGALWAGGDDDRSPRTGLWSRG